MVRISNRVQKLIDNYITKLEENGFTIKKAFLFGSYAKGNAHENSDIDIALVSDEFEGIRFYDKDKIRRTTISVSSQLEVLPFKTSDFTDDDPFVKEILETGVRIV